MSLFVMTLRVAGRIEVIEYLVSDFESANQR